MTVEAPAAIRIRSALPSDLEACATLDHSTNTDYVWQMEHSDLDGTLNVAFRTARLPRTMRLRYPRSGAALQLSWDIDACFLVAERDLEIVGYVNMHERRAYGTGWVTDLVVDPNWRRRGVGTSLFNGAWAWARERELARVIVETTTKNYPAIRFLQKAGLAFCGYNDLYYPNHDIALFFGQGLR